MTDKIHKNFCPSCGAEKMSRKRDVGKICNKCNAKKVAKEHSYKRIKADKATDKQYADEYRKKYSDDFDWRLKRMLHTVKSRAKLKGYEFDLSLQDLYELWPIDNKCPVLGITLIFGHSKTERKQSVSPFTLCC